jgi:serine O-acetyltransferase
VTGTHDGLLASADGQAVDASARWPIAVDLEKHYALLYHSTHPSLPRRLWSMVWHWGFHCVAVYRLGQWAQRLAERSWLLALPPFAVWVVLQFLVRLLHKVDVSHRARIGPGFYLGHPATIFIGPARIGSNVNVTHNVTIGFGFGARRGFPTIGNDVWIGPGATLTGRITVGDGATIAAGAVVSQDVPPGALVAGNPSRVVMARYGNHPLLGYPLDGLEPPGGDAPGAAVGAGSR